jgi:hypothetical protein
MIIIKKKRKVSHRKKKERKKKERNDSATEYGKGWRGGSNCASQGLQKVAHDRR